MPPVFQVSYLIVDGPPCPELVRDMHWHESPADETPLQLPYTKETSHDRKEVCTFLVSWDNFLLNIEIPWFSSSIPIYSVS